MNNLTGWRKNVLVVLFALFLIIELPIVATGQLAKPQPADAIIVLGAKVIGREPSTMLRLRLDEAVKLYRQGYAPFIIVSGGRGPDEEISEAEAMAAYLAAHGIPADRILSEPASHTTLENLVNSRAIMENRGLATAIIVSNASHLHRSLILARYLGMEVSAAPAPMVGVYLTAKQYLREAAAMVVTVVAPQ